MAAEADLARAKAGAVRARTEAGRIASEANRIGSEAMASAAGVRQAVALAQQIQMLNREAAVMTFNNLFVLIAGFLALSILVFPLLTRAKPDQGSGGIH